MLFSLGIWYKSSPVEIWLVQIECLPFVYTVLICAEGFHAAFTVSSPNTWLQYIWKLTIGVNVTVRSEFLPHDCGVGVSRIELILRVSKQICSENVSSPIKSNKKNHFWHNKRCSSCHWKIVRAIPNYDDDDDDDAPIHSKTGCVVRVGGAYSLLSIIATPANHGHL